MSYIHEVKNFLIENAYCEEEIRILEDTIRRIVNSDAVHILDDLVNAYCKDERIDPEKLRSESSKMAYMIKEHEYTVIFVIYCVLVQKLKCIYSEKGFDEELYSGVARDLRAKFDECKAVKNIYGTFSVFWFDRYLNFEIFAIGRLQFQFKPMPVHYEKDGICIRKGDLAIALHIPSGCRLEERDVLFSIERAKAFFVEKMSFVPKHFFCTTYLFHPAMTSLYKQDSNLYKFCRLFDIFYSSSDHPNSDVWRIFSCDCDDYTQLPEKTSLQRSLKSYLINGGQVGVGIGVLKKEYMMGSPFRLQHVNSDMLQESFDNSIRHMVK